LTIAVAEAVLLGALGGATWVLLDYYHHKRVRIPLLKLKQYALRVVLGAVAAYVFCLTGMPNHLNAFAAGYLAPAFLTKLTERPPR